jgi:hypothetical protein
MWAVAELKSFCLLFVMNLCKLCSKYIKKRNIQMILLYGIFMFHFDMVVFAVYTSCYCSH